MKPFKICTTVIYAEAPECIRLFSIINSDPWEKQEGKATQVASTYLTWQFCLC